MSLPNQKGDALNPAEILGAMKRTAAPYSAITAFGKVVHNSNKKMRTKSPTPNDTNASKNTNINPNQLISTPQQAFTSTAPKPMKTTTKQTPLEKNKTPKQTDVATPASAPSSSSITPTAPASSTDIYDAMLGEISDLLMAAQQAQTLGRLKMASTYQLLVHARLVGLGKRFDRFLAHGAGNITGAGNSNTNTNVNANEGASGSGAGPMSKTRAERSLTFPTPSNEESGVHTAEPVAGVNDASAHMKKMDQDNSGGTNATTDESAMKQAQETLAKILPTEIDLDNTMMEHLARAAMELHNKRTGRGMLHERIEAKKNLSETAAAASTPGGGVAWTDEEKDKCIRAATSYGREKYEAIAFAVGTRTPAEVKAHLKNLDGRERVQRDLASDGVKKEKESAGADSDSGINLMAGDASVTPEKQRRGRGKKPPSKAMLTVCSAAFDAKKMVSGGL
jgi:hypothetical protein